MSLHINRFVDKIKAAESRRQRDITLTMAEARDLHADITRLLLVVEDARQKLENSSVQTVSVEVDGGSF